MCGDICRLNLVAESLLSYDEWTNCKLDNIGHLVYRGGYIGFLGGLLQNFLLFFLKLVCLQVIYFIFRSAFPRTNVCLKMDSVLEK